MELALQQVRSLQQSWLDEKADLTASCQHAIQTTQIKNSLLQQQTEEVWKCVAEERQVMMENLQMLVIEKLQLKDQIHQLEHQLLKQQTLIQQQPTTIVQTPIIPIPTTPTPPPPSAADTAATANTLAATTALAAATAEIQSLRSQALLSAQTIQLLTTTLNKIQQEKEELSLECHSLREANAKLREANQLIVRPPYSAQGVQDGIVRPNSTTPAGTSLTHEPYSTTINSVAQVPPSFSRISSTSSSTSNSHVSGASSSLTPRPSVPTSRRSTDEGVTTSNRPSTSQQTTPTAARALQLTIQPSQTVSAAVDTALGESTHPTSDDVEAKQSESMTPTRLLQDSNLATFNHPTTITTAPASAVTPTPTTPPITTDATLSQESYDSSVPAPAPSSSPSLPGEVSSSIPMIDEETPTRDDSSQRQPGHTDDSSSRNEPPLEDGVALLDMAQI